MKKRSNRRERNSPPLQSTPINQYKNIEQTKTPTPSIIRLINPANQDESQSLPRLKDNPLNKPALKTRPENFQTNDSRQLTRPVNFSTKAKKKEETSRRSGRLLVYASRTLDWSRSRKRFLLSKVVESLGPQQGEGKEASEGRGETCWACLDGRKNGDAVKNLDDEKEGEVGGGGRLMRDNKLHLSSQWSRVKPRDAIFWRRTRTGVYISSSSRGSATHFYWKFTPAGPVVSRKNLPFSPFFFLHFPFALVPRDRTISRKM